MSIWKKRNKNRQVIKPGTENDSDVSEDKIKIELTREQYDRLHDILLTCANYYIKKLHDRDIQGHNVGRQWYEILKVVEYAFIDHNEKKLSPGDCVVTPEQLMRDALERECQSKLIRLAKKIMDDVHYENIVTIEYMSNIVYEIDELIDTVAGRKK